MGTPAYKLHAFEAFPKSKRAAQKRQLFRQPFDRQKPILLIYTVCIAHGLNRTLR